jgi:hypothetical protein
VYLDLFIVRYFGVISFSLKLELEVGTYTIQERNISYDVIGFYRHITLKTEEVFESIRHRVKIDGVQFVKTRSELNVSPCSFLFIRPPLQTGLPKRQFRYRTYVNNQPFCRSQRPFRKQITKARNNNKMDFKLLSFSVNSCTRTESQFYQCSVSYNVFF